MAEPIDKWSLSGDCVEGCTSPAVCPLWWGSSVPTDMHDGKDQCEGVFTFCITKGRHEQVDLSGLLAGFGFNTGVGGSSEPWKAVLYLDERANDDQFQRMEKIFGMCWNRLGQIIKVKRTSISFTKENVGTHPGAGFRHEVVYNGIYYLKADPILSQDGSARFISGERSNAKIYVARSSQNKFTDKDLPRTWDRPGMSSTYFDFNISPSKLAWAP